MYLETTGIVHETTAPYTPQQNGVAERKNRVLTEMVNALLSNSGLSSGFWGEALLTACHILNRVPQKRNKVTPYELWNKRKPNLNYLRVWGCRAVVKLPEPKKRKLGERGVECIFIGYAQHSKAYRFMVIEPSDSISVNSVIESRDAIFDENRFKSVIKNVPTKNVVVEEDEDHREIVEVPTIRKSKRARKVKSFGTDFYTYLVEGSREAVVRQIPVCFNTEADPQTLEEAIKDRDAALWKEALNDEMDSIMGNNTWELVDLPPGWKPIKCRFIFRRKRRVDGSIEKYKVRLVAKGFTQKQGIDYFDTYSPVARIATIRLLIAIAAIHKLYIHQMDVKTAFLNGELDEEIYMEQPEGFATPGQEKKVCKLLKSLYGLKQAPMQWHKKFDQVILADGFKINESDKCVYTKFNASGNGVIICLYVDDMLIFGTDMVQVQLTKDFLSSKFNMKDLGEADVILGIQIIRNKESIEITQSGYIEKILKKFNHFDCTPASTPLYPSLELVKNTGSPVSQLEYSRLIGCLMYAMTSTRPDIALAVGKLSRFTSNPSDLHWFAIRRVLKYLKKTINYSLCYTGYPSVLEGYSDASWIVRDQNHASTTGWIFTLGGGAISWASRKQTLLASSTMESEFIALDSATKEAEWLRELLHEIPLWPKPIAPISIRCDNEATLARAYSQVYNGKSRHIGLRHSCVRQLITNGVITIDYVRSSQNLADPLTKALPRDVVNKTSRGMGLKPMIQ